MPNSDEMSFCVNDHGDMIESDGQPVYCDSETCDSQAAKRARVSVNTPHDQTRNYCYQCYNAYMVGVQHGRHHEAAIHHAEPGRGSSQDSDELPTPTKPAQYDYVAKLTHLTAYERWCVHSNLATIKQTGVPIADHLAVLRQHGYHRIADAVQDTHTNTTPRTP